MTDHHFNSPRRLIGRAQSQIREVEDTVTRFFAASPYARVVDVNPDSGEEVHKFRMTQPFPADDLEIVVKEAAGHLRDALDHACYAAAVALGEARPDNTGFPFAKSAAGVKGELDSKRLSGNPVEIRPLLEGFQPHEGGNDLLWGLNSIRNPNTHRFILPVGQAVTGNTRFTGIVNGPFQSGYSEWNEAKNEVEYMRIGAGSQISYDVNVAFTVVLEGIHALARKPLIATLNAVAREVESVVNAIEAETLRVIAARQ